jgi:hypothetical protein
MMVKDSEQAQFDTEVASTLIYCLVIHGHELDMEMEAVADSADRPRTLPL